ncbi:MAG TPA: hypothetical protein VFX49_08700 [Chloroflexota bacterium]|nr:hypothetical protein [Chloroflexota bacterium]
MTTFSAVAPGSRIRPAAVRPFAGLAGAVVLTVALFSSGLAALDHMDWLARTATGFHSGSFSSGSQGDYAPTAPQRVAPQRR